MASLRTPALLFALALFMTCSGGDPELETVLFTGDGGQRVELRVEIADTSQEMQRGLMFRESLPKDQGMLFDFGYQSEAPFWMKDTSIPLSVAFISADGVILNIQDMQPFSTDLHKSPQPYSFAVEVNQGWFGRHGVREGSSVQLPPSHRTGPA